MDRKWEKGIKVYDLFDGYTLEKANLKEFSIHFSVYEIFDTNIWFRQSFDIGCSILDESTPCFWIKMNGHRIGGVLIEPNYMNCLFLEPPYSDYELIISKLKGILLEWSEVNSPIYVGCVKPDKVKYYERLGFKSGESRRCMIRPTESFNVTWEDDYKIVSPGRESIEDISKLFLEAFRRTVDNKESYEEAKRSLEYYFNSSEESSLLRKASTLVYDKKSNELLGACLILDWENWPNIYDIAVSPKAQGKGLAKNMIRAALTALKNEYPVLRLFVTLGNDAENLYHRMGFLSGVETTEMILTI